MVYFLDVWISSIFYFVLLYVFHVENRPYVTPTPGASTSGGKLACWFFFFTKITDIIKLISSVKIQRLFDTKRSSLTIGSKLIMINVDNSCIIQILKVHIYIYDSSVTNQHGIRNNSKR